MGMLLSMQHISKRFSNNEVLRDVCFEVMAGEVHALVGENGAGKSTLVKILGGIYPKNSGKIFLEGKEVEFSSVVDAQNCGVSIIHQELMLMQHLSVAENIYMGREIKNKLGLVDIAEEELRAQELLNAFGMYFSAATMVKDLTIAQQQMVEIIRAVSFNAKIIAMDEPTSSLSEREAEILFDLINNLKKRGIGIILISHRLSDIFRVSDRITVLRDGIHVGTKIASETNSDELVSLMVGRDIKMYYSEKDRNIAKNIVAMNVSHLSDGDMVKDVSFELRKGEILGMAGLVGAGRSETLKCIFGITNRVAGEIEINGRSIEFKTPIEAMNEGIGFVPEDRKLSGLFLKNNVRFNMTINVLEHFLNKLRYVRSREMKIVNDYVDKMQIKITGQEQIVGFLSGGNQQKVLISKWLASTKGILLLDEPTRGVDVKTKEDIYHLINELAEEGISIVFVSSELPELLNVCDRIHVLSNGKSMGTLEKDEYDEETIMKLATKEFVA